MIKKSNIPAKRKNPATDGKTLWVTWGLRRGFSTIVRRRRLNWVVQRNRRRIVGLLNRFFRLIVRVWVFFIVICHKSMILSITKIASLSDSGIDHNQLFGGCMSFGSWHAKLATSDVTKPATIAFTPSSASTGGIFTLVAILVAVQANPAVVRLWPTTRSLLKKVGV